jgi:hypothetical protein
MTIQPPELIQLQQDRLLSYVCFPSISEFPPHILELLLGGQSNNARSVKAITARFAITADGPVRQSNNTAKAVPSIATTPLLGGEVECVPGRPGTILMWDWRPPTLLNSYFQNGRL